MSSNSIKMWEPKCDLYGEECDELDLPTDKHEYYDYDVTIGRDVVMREHTHLKVRALCQEDAEKAVADAIEHGHKAILQPRTGWRTLRKEETYGTPMSHPRMEEVRVSGTNAGTT